METKIKQKGSSNKETATVKKDVQKKLTEEAVGKTPVQAKTVGAEKPTINLDDRIQKFEKLKGLITAKGVDNMVPKNCLHTTMAICNAMAIRYMIKEVLNHEHSLMKKET